MSDSVPNPSQDVTGAAASNDTFDYYDQLASLVEKHSKYAASKIGLSYSVTTEIIKASMYEFVVDFIGLQEEEQERISRRDTRRD